MFFCFLSFTPLFLDLLIFQIWKNDDVITEGDGVTNWWWWHDESLVSSLPVTEREGGTEKLDGGGRDKTWSRWTGAVRQRSHRSDYTNFDHNQKCAKTYTYDHTDFDHNLFFHNQNPDHTTYRSAIHKVFDHMIIGPDLSSLNRNFDTKRLILTTSSSLAIKSLFSCPSFFMICIYVNKSPQIKLA